MATHLAHKSLQLEETEELHRCLRELRALEERDDTASVEDLIFAYRAYARAALPILKILSSSAQAMMESAGDVDPDFADFVDVLAGEFWETSSIHADLEARPEKSAPGAQVKDWKGLVEKVDNLLELSRIRSQELYSQQRRPPSPRRRQEIHRDSIFGKFFYGLPSEVHYLLIARGNPEVLLLLEEAHDSTNISGLGLLAQRIVALCASDSERTALEVWLKVDGSRWAGERRPALAAVIEAAAQLDIPGAEEVVAEVLEDEDADPTVATVAAQRCRRLLPATPDVRVRIGDALIRRIEHWGRDEAMRASALQASVSLAPVAGERHVGWIERRIREGEGQESWAVVQGILDWAGTSPSMLSESAKERLLGALLSRLTIEQQRTAVAPPGERDLRAVLVWTLGAVATGDDLDRVAPWLARAFKDPVGLEAAAAVRSARLLVRRWSGKAIHALEAASSTFDPAMRARFFTLINTAR